MLNLTNEELEIIVIEQSGRTSTVQTLIDEDTGEPVVIERMNFGDDFDLKETEEKIRNYLESNFTGRYDVVLLNSIMKKELPQPLTEKQKAFQKKMIESFMKSMMGFDQINEN